MRPNVSEGLRPLNVQPVSKGSLTVGVEGITQ